MSKKTKTDKKDSAVKTESTQAVTVTEEVQEQITKQTEFLASITELSVAHESNRKAGREQKATDIKALMAVVASAESAGVKLSHAQIAKAYGVHKSWITKAFGVIGDKDKVTSYINGRISLLGVDKSMKTDKDKLRNCHSDMVQEGKKPTARTLAEESGIDIDTCRQYLSEYLGKSLIDMSNDTVKQIESYCNFQPKKDGGVKNGELKLIKTDLPDDVKATQLTLDLVNLIQNKKKNSTLMLSVMRKSIEMIEEQKTKARQSEEVKQAEEEETEETVIVTEEVKENQAVA